MTKQSLIKYTLVDGTITAWVVDGQYCIKLPLEPGRRIRMSSDLKFYPTVNHLFNDNVGKKIYVGGSDYLIVKNPRVYGHVTISEFLLIKNNIVYTWRELCQKSL